MNTLTLIKYWKFSTSIVIVSIMSNASVCIAQSSRNYQEISEFREGIKESNAFFKAENRLESKVLLDSLSIPFFTLDDSLITVVGFDLGESYSKLGDFEAAAKIFETVILHFRSYRRHYKPDKRSL